MTQEVRPWELFFNSPDKSSERSLAVPGGVPWLVEQLALWVLKLSPEEDFQDSSEVIEEVTAQSLAADAGARPSPIATSDLPSPSPAPSPRRPRNTSSSCESGQVRDHNGAHGVERE